MQSYRAAVTRVRHPVNVAPDERAARGPDRERRCGLHGQLAVHHPPDGRRRGLGRGQHLPAFHFDPYPFIVLNLAFSTQATYAAPLILLASNQSAVRDRAALEQAVAEEKDADMRNRLTRIEAMLAEMAGKTS